MTGLLVPAVILGQQDASLPPPPAVRVYTADTPAPTAPGLLPGMDAAPIAPPGQAPQMPPASVVTPAFPPAPAPEVPPAPVPETPPAPAPETPPAPARRELPPVQPIATTVEGPAATGTSDRVPAPGPIQQTGHVESNAAAPAPAPAPAGQGAFRDNGLPFDPPTLGQPASTGPASAGTGSGPRTSGPPSTGLVMEEAKSRSERSPEGVAGSSGPGQGASLVLETAAPPRTVIGKPVLQRIVVRNIGSTDAIGVRVEEALQPGVRPGHSEPPAALMGNRLAWDLGTVEAGGERKVQVELEAGEPMTLELSPTLNFLGAQTRIVQPELTLKGEGPERVLRGEVVMLRLLASNNGTRPLHQVRLHYEVPEGLKHPGGKRIGLTLQTPLEPGEKRPINLELQSVQAGKWDSCIVAEADNGIRSEVRHEVLVVEPVLGLRLSGPVHSLAEEEVIFRIEVDNPGPAPVSQGRVVLLMPSGVEPIATQPRAEYNALRRTLKWTMSTLPVKTPQVMLVKARAQSAGEWRLLAQVEADQRTPTRCRQVVQVEAPPPLGVEIDGKDALDMGEETVYVVRVLNLTRQTQSNLRLTVQKPPTLAAVAADGPVHGTVQQHLVRYQTLPRLEPSKEGVFRIRARGQAPGPGVLRVEVSAAGLRAPLVKEAHVVVGNRGGRATGAGAAR